jgi:hypothetical protein
MNLQKKTHFPIAPQSGFVCLSANKCQDFRVILMYIAYIDAITKSKN